MNVDYESRNQVWVWDADGDGYFEGRSARLADAISATGQSAAALAALMHVDPCDGLEDEE
jgi:hypothetical protein